MNETEKTKEIKIPNDFMDKYASLFTTGEQYQAVLDLIRQAYLMGIKDGEIDEYNRVWGD